MLRLTSMHNHRPLVDLNHISKVVTREVDLTSNRLTLATAHLHQPTQATAITIQRRRITTSIQITKTILPTGARASIAMNRLATITKLVITTLQATSTIRIAIHLLEIAVTMANTTVKVTCSSSHKVAAIREAKRGRGRKEWDRPEPSRMIHWQLSTLIKEVVVVL